jgi:protein TonB
MKIKTWFFIAFLTFVKISFSQHTNENENQEEIILVDPDIPATFPGGEVGLLKFIKENLKYPDTCNSLEATGRVYLRFVVEKDGNITNIEVEKNLTGCDQFAIACMGLLSSMPKWEPGGTQDINERYFEPMRITYRLPILYNPIRH